MFSIKTLSILTALLTSAIAHAASIHEIIYDIEDCPVPRSESRADMIHKVDHSWDFPKVHEEHPWDNFTNNASDNIQQKLKTIRIPNVNFNEAPLSNVISFLAELSTQFDPDGVNIVLIDPDKRNPTVTFSLRNVSLNQILGLVAKSVNFHYDIEDEVITFRPGGSELSHLKN